MSRSVWQLAVRLLDLSDAATGADHPAPSSGQPEGAEHPATSSGTRTSVPAVGSAAEAAGCHCYQLVPHQLVLRARTIKEVYVCADHAASGLHGTHAAMLMTGSYVTGTCRKGRAPPASPGRHFGFANCRMRPWTFRQLALCHAPNPPGHNEQRQQRAEQQDCLRANLTVPLCTTTATPQTASCSGSHDSGQSLLPWRRWLLHSV